MVGHRRWPALTGSRPSCRFPRRTCCNQKALAATAQYWHDGAANHKKSKCNSFPMTEGMMGVIRPALAAFLVLSSFIAPASAAKRDNSIRFAADQVIDN